MKRLIFLFLLFPITLIAGIVQVDQQWSPERYVPSASVQEHYDRGCQALDQSEWDEALVNFLVVIYHFQDTPFYADALYYTGVCYYFKADLDLSNRQFDRYLTSTEQLKHFEKIFEFKYHIADYYMQGKKKHLFGVAIFPKWGSGKGNAIDLLDEIIAALPGKELAARALFTKAEVLRKQKEYRESIECLQMLSRRFPKHSLSADSFVLTSEIYYEQSTIEAQNPDLISLARLNINRFSKSFPGDARIDVVESNLVAMQEVYAESLLKTGEFYERKKKPHASAIYYQDAVRKYPETIAAQKSQERLNHILDQLQEINA